MSRLISANLTRAFKGKLFWLVALAALIFSGMNAGEILLHCTPADTDKCMECVFNSIPIMAIFVPAFSGLFLGDDYRCGTLRTKILSGVSREAAYVSNYVTVLVCSIIILFASLLPAAMTLLLYVESPAAIVGKLISNILASVMITAALCAIFTLMGMLISSKSAGAVAAIVFSFVLILFASYIDSRLCAPEMISDMSFSIDGVIVSGEPYPNPEYVGGWLRTVFEIFRDILPTGQGILIANNEMKHYLLSCMVSLSEAVIISLFGVMFFSRKDLR